MANKPILFTARTDGSAVPAGVPGETLNNNPVAGIPVAASTQFANVATVTLTKGVWMVMASISPAINVISGWTYFQSNISTSSSTNDTNSVGGIVAYVPASPTAANGYQTAITLGPRFFNVTVDTPVYLVGRIDYSSQSGSTYNVNSRISAIRIA